jgi:predicted nucleotidyltransferase
MATGAARRDPVKGGSMAIPLLDANGLLPIGVHDCTLDDIKEVFGAFQSTDRRIQLYQELERFASELKRTGLVKEVIVDGSFVTGKTAPSDIDLILVLPDSHDFDADLRPFEYNVLSRRRVRKHYQFDILLAREDGDEYEQYLRFFQQVRGQPTLSKGVLRLRP